jgi:hypothetical protein
VPAQLYKVCLAVSPEPYSYPDTGTAPGRPVRSNRGTGGQRAQLEKASEIVGKGLLNKVTGQKRDRNNLIATHEDLSENDLAPPIPPKRARINKEVIISHSFFLLFFCCIKNEYY